MVKGPAYLGLLCGAFERDEAQFEIGHLLLEHCEPLRGGGVYIAGIGFELAEADSGGIVVIRESPEKARFGIVRALIDVLFEPLHCGQRVLL